MADYENSPRQSTRNSPVVEGPAPIKSHLALLKRRLANRNTTRDSDSSLVIGLSEKVSIGSAQIPPGNEVSRAGDSVFEDQKIPESNLDGVRPTPNSLVRLQQS